MLNKEKVMTKKIVKKSKHVRLLEGLVNGKTYTLGQIKTQFKAANPADVVYKLRKLGVDVITTQKNDKTYYSL